MPFIDVRVEFPEGVEVMDLYDLTRDRVLSLREIAETRPEARVEKLSMVHDAPKMALDFSEFRGCGGAER